MRGSETEGEEDLGTGGFMTEMGEDLRKGSWAGLAPDDPGSEAYFTSFHFTSSSSGLRSGRAPEGHATKVMSEISCDL